MGGQNRSSVSGGSRQPGLPTPGVVAASIGPPWRRQGRRNPSLVLDESPEAASPAGPASLVFPGTRWLRFGRCGTLTEHQEEQTKEGTSLRSSTKGGWAARGQISERRQLKQKRGTEGDRGPSRRGLPGPRSQRGGPAAAALLRGQAGCSGEAPSLPLSPLSPGGGQDAGQGGALSCRGG